MYRPQGLRLRLLSLLDARPLVTLPPDTAAAAVLVPIVAADDEARLIFTKRSDTLSRHAGEISFPGGLAEPREDMAAAALRETEEELGREFQHEGRSFQTFVYELAGNLIWGATARILSSLIGLLGENGPTAPRREGV